MKKLVVLLAAVGFLCASDLIPLARIEALAQEFINQKFGFHYLDEVITYYGIDELPGAYAFVYRNVDKEPLTIVMGARYTTSPVNELSRALPRSRSVYEKVLHKAKTLGYGEPQFQKTYYFGPGQEYCAFKIGDKEMLINACTFNTIEKSLLFDSKPEPNQELEQLTKEKWEKYFSKSRFDPQDTAYIPEVPFIDWTYGCSPTAASMIFWYWDSHYYNGLTYGRFVDYFFTRWEIVYGQWKDGANVNRELSVAMYTDSMTGATYGSIRIRDGMVSVANDVNGYSCSAGYSGEGGSWNQWHFAWIKTEIDAGRPCVWSVHDHWPQVWDAGHSLTAVGYWIEHPDTFVRVHTTWGWGPDEPLWPLWTYHEGIYSQSRIVSFVPGGGNDNNIFLDFPLGGILFKNLKYKIRWTSAGSDIDHVKIWWSYGRQATSYDSLNWTLVEADAPNTGEYIWTVPDQDSILRVNIVGLSSTDERLAADGSFNKIQCAFPAHSPNLNLVGHFDTEESATDVVVINDYAYITDGANGLLAVDVSDSSFPELITQLPLPGYSVALCALPPYLYIADKTDTVRVVSISDPANPVQVGICHLDVDEPTDIFGIDTLLYVSCRVSGLKIVNIANASTPVEIGSYDTPGQAYDVMVVDTIAYVADGVKGLRVLNVTDPTDPVEIGFYDTNGITQGLALDGNRLYLAEGGTGIKIFDVTDPTNPQQLGSFDTPGTAKKVSIYDSLFVADAYEGIRVIDVSNPSSPVEIGFLESYGTAINLAHVRNMLYLADIVDGLYLIHEDITPGIEEMTNGDVASDFTISSPQRGYMKFNVSLNKTSTIFINVYDALGRLVKSMRRGNLFPGEYEFKWLPEAAGVYFVHVKTHHNSMARKVVFLK